MYRERDRYRCVYIYIYIHTYTYNTYIYIYIHDIYIYIYVYIRPALGSGAPLRFTVGQTSASPACRRRENMLGANMVLAESAKFKYGLYNSCVVECFEGFMLEPCLLQP